MSRKSETSLQICAHLAKEKASAMVGRLPTIARLVAGVAAISGVSYYIWTRRHRNRAYVVIGPYDTALEDENLMALQRMVIDQSKESLHQRFHPLQSQLSTNPVRESDNGHGQSGAVRDAARRLIQTSVTSNGFELHEISPAEQSPIGGTYTHRHFAPSDLHLGSSDQKPSPNAIVVGIDVDYYFNRERAFEQLLGHGNAAIFHTFAPLTVSGKDGDSFFRIDNNVVQYEVGNGGSWQHFVWDWCAAGEFIETRVPLDGINLKRRLLKLFGIEKFVVHKICHARPWEKCPNRALVWLIPQFSYSKVTWLPSELHCRKLKRVDFADKDRPGWNTFVFPAKGELMISIGRNNTDYQTTITKDLYDVLRGCQTAQSASARMIQSGIDDVKTLALMTQYFAGKDLVVHESDRAMSPMQPLQVHWPASIEVDAIEVSSRNYASPIFTDENMMPMIKRWEVLSNSIDHRVSYVMNNKIPSVRIEQLANEYLKQLVPIPGKGVPYSLEQTAEMLNKPSQILAIKQIIETVDMRHRHLIECFIKNEPTDKSGRIISSFADFRFMLKFSSFTLQFRDEVLHGDHNEHWFCPGLTPHKIAEKVVDYVQLTTTPIEGDFSNFDGSVSAWCQKHIMNGAILRHFGPSFKKELSEYTDMLISCPARAKNFGFRYEAGPGVKSGSPTTCDLNTVLNGFIQYAAVRLTLPELDNKGAFQMIGLAFGDDSLFESRFRRNFVKVAEQLGMQLKVESFDETKGLTFLARVFPDPYRSLTSFQDPLRTCKKLHLTTRDPNIPLADAAVDRVSGYLVTDALTPVISNYCKMVERYYKPLIKDEDVRLARKSVDKEKPYWLFGNNSWPQAAEDSELMLNCFAARVKISVPTLRSLMGLFDRSNAVWFDSIDRDDEPKYQNTLLSDGTPTSDVEARLTQDVRKRVHQRAPGRGRKDNRPFKVEPGNDGSSTASVAPKRQHSGDDSRGRRIDENRNITNGNRDPVSNNRSTCSSSDSTKSRSSNSSGGGASLEQRTSSSASRSFQQPSAPPMR
nr:MAG: hypothetical protein [Sichuan forest noda-like virus 7]